MVLQLNRVPRAASETPRLQEIRKEGYLWKINKKKKRRVRKYFVLVGGSLTWTLKPTVRPLAFPIAFEFHLGTDSPLSPFTLR